MRHALILLWIVIEKGTSSVMTFWVGRFVSGAIQRSKVACNIVEYQWDGGDCCEDTCADASHDCGKNGYDCKDPKSESKYLYTKKYSGFEVTLLCDKVAQDNQWLWWWWFWILFFLTLWNGMAWGNRRVEGAYRQRRKHWFAVGCHKRTDAWHETCPQQYNDCRQSWHGAFLGALGHNPHFIHLSKQFEKQLSWRLFDGEE